MGYLDFDKEEITNLNVSLKKEFLRTNRAGSYASSTIVNCNTRKYHGLLVCPLADFGGEKFVLLSNLHETIVQHGAEFNMGINKYPFEFHPAGHKYINSFSCDPTPTVEYQVGGVLLRKEMLLVEEDERILVKYTLLEAHSKTTLRLRPFLAFRNVHHLTRANKNANTRPEKSENGIKHKMYPGFPYLHMQISKTNEFVVAPDWFFNVEYDKERERGFEFNEDLFTPGNFEMPIKKGESVIFSAGLSKISTSTLPDLFDTELKKRTPRNTFENCLENACQQFISKKGRKTEIIASFPWYGNWGRDSLVALPGLLLSRKDFKTAKAVLDTITSELDGHSYKNIGNYEHSNVESIDTPLWYFWAVQKYAYATGDFAGVRKNYGEKLNEIAGIFRDGQNPSVKMHDNGLLFLPDAKKALTWMDATVDGYPVVPRYGFVVEINALWYNAIKFLLELDSKAKVKSDMQEWEEIAADVETSFKDIFWLSEKGYLADFVVNDYSVTTVRPNQLFATSLPYSPISDTKKHAILEVVEKELLTPRGIRSLTPKHSTYRGMHQGTKRDRDLAYHQGTVWPWLLGPFAEGYLKIHQKAGLRLIKKLYEGFEPEIFNHGIGTISEVYDGNPPYEPRGSISQAWSVAALMTMKQLIDEYESM